jgi:DDE superfamily endonuclease
LRFYEQGRLVLCAEEKTGRQILHRASPTHPRQPGTPEKRDPEDIRHGVRALLASFVVPTGPIVGPLGRPRTRADWAAHLAHVVPQLPAMARYAWVVDKLTTPWSREVCRLGAPWCEVPGIPKALPRGAQRRAFLSDPTPKPVFHLTPTQGSWLNQVELWFRVFARQLLTRGDFDAVADFETRLSDSLEVYNTPHAHPYRWTSTGQPLVRATPVSQTRHQQRQGRAWFSPRPKRFERTFSPPRPYKPAATSLVANL